MSTPTSWRFHGQHLIAVSRDPPLPAQLEKPVMDLLAELTNRRQGMEDFLEVWREYKYRNDPEEALVGNHCEIHFVGDRVHLYPLYDEQWDDVEDVWLPLDEVEDMFREYSAWAFGGS